jgi:hypothetical protein
VVCRLLSRMTGMLVLPVTNLYGAASSVIAENHENGITPKKFQILGYHPAPASALCLGLT